MHLEVCVFVSGRLPNGKLNGVEFVTYFVHGSLWNSIKLMQGKHAFSCLSIYYSRIELCSVMMIKKKVYGLVLCSLFIYCLSPVLFLLVDALCSAQHGCRQETCMKATQTKMENGESETLQGSRVRLFWLHTLSEMWYTRGYRNFTSHLLWLKWKHVFAPLFLF